MKKIIFCVLLSALLLTACTPLPIPDPTVSTTVPTTTAPETTAPPETTTPPETTVPPETVPETTVPPEPGWFTEAGKTYYRNEDGSLHTGWLELDGKRYYMQPDGAMARGETVIEGRSFFFLESGEEIIIANPWNAIRDDYVPDLVEAENGYRVDRSCVDALLQMLRDCRKAGYDAQITSAYRDHETQVYLYERKVNYYLDLGYALEDARREAGTVVAVPSTSEHELGLAVDLVDSSYWVLDEYQEDTKAQKWLMAHCWEYGFILRYPSDKSAFTGIIYEPWHYRYVGLAVAKELQESGLCLEEYLNSITE